MKLYDNQIEGLSNYLIFPDSRVYSIKSQQFLKPLPDGRGYYRYDMWGDNHKRVMWKIHRLVATVYLENPWRCNFVHHNNSDPWENCIFNLEWVTQRENNLFVREIIVRRFWEKQQELDIGREHSQFEYEG